MDSQLRVQIERILDQNRVMTLATIRPDGWPQVTTAGFAHDGQTRFFLCGPDSQKAANLAGDGRVSLPVDHDTGQVMALEGLATAARAQPRADPAEADAALR